jgi:hypothetical protein
MVPNSVDVTRNKAKAQHLKLVQLSDQEDTSTQASNRVVSSKSRIRNANAQYYNGQYQAKTPGSLPSIEKLSNLAPDFNYEYNSHVSKRHNLGYRKQHDSSSMSRVLGGIGYNRYGNGASNVVLNARNERGPCPKNLYKSPSIPSIISEVDRKSAQYQEDL